MRGASREITSLAMHLVETGAKEAFMTFLLIVIWAIVGFLYFTGENVPTPEKRISANAKSHFQDALACVDRSTHATNRAACRPVVVSTFWVVLKIRGAEISGSNSIDRAVKRQKVWQPDCTSYQTGRQAMKPQERETGIRDRISTRQELGEVIVQLVELRQLSFDDTLGSLELSDERSQENDLELWDRNRDDLRGAKIESLTNIILGRKQLCN
jgi:hypothetical protein